MPGIAQRVLGGLNKQWEAKGDFGACKKGSYISFRKGKWEGLEQNFVEQHLLSICDARGSKPRTAKKKTKKEKKGKERKNERMKER